jgi:hypothetical protein
MARDTITPNSRLAREIGKRLVDDDLVSPEVAQDLIAKMQSEGIESSDWTNWALAATKDRDSEGAASE